MFLIVILRLSAAERPCPREFPCLGGLLILVGGLSVLTGARPDLGAVLIAVFLVGVTPAMHNFWAISDPNQRMGEMVNFTKNLALLWGCLDADEGNRTLSQSLFDRRLRRC